ncbi:MULTISPECIES: amino-acid N-acetyltransferase [Rothia]|uniref:N-acetylglutamate synthase n=1 Tax=Rothia nasimurium TaxID=85336 RepID=A0A1Y1RP05_9MICC|nr:MULTISPECIES: amino-acid N-acetyltransferase [Rothia]ORC16575.1 N-acetylglutamate synthase [Rothia nasimurium]
MNQLQVRPATVHDVPAIQALVRPLALEGILLDKETVAYYEAVQEFLLVEDTAGQVLGCGALHVMWENIAEIRTLAASPGARGRGVGHTLVTALLGRARALGVSSVFCLTFEVDFFKRQGFRVMENQEQLEAKTYMELLRSHDEGVAEFLNLARVKPNTLGNTRMIIEI